MSYSWETKKKSGFGAKFLKLAFWAAALGAAPAYRLGTVDTQTVHIDKIETAKAGQDYTRILTNAGSYKNENSWIGFKFRQASHDLDLQMKAGKDYDVTSYGWNFWFLEKNIVSVREIETAVAPATSTPPATPAPAPTATPAAATGSDRIYTAVEIADLIGKFMESDNPTLDSLKAIDAKGSLDVDAYFKYQKYLPNTADSGIESADLITWATERKYNDIVRWLVIEKKAAIPKAGYMDDHPLFIAAATKNAALVRFYLDQKVDPLHALNAEAADRRENALDAARAQGTPEIAKMIEDAIKAARAAKTAAAPGAKGKM